MYTSKVFDKASTEELVSIVYSFYQVHAGTVHFFQKVEDDLNEQINEKVGTHDLLRILQAFSEIAD